MWLLDYDGALLMRLPAEETDAFLARVFGGRAGHMVAFLAGRGALTWEDVDEIYAVLLNTEKEDR